MRPARLIRWWFRRWRAAHYLSLARAAFDADPSPLTAYACGRARSYLWRIDANRP